MTYTRRFTIDNLDLSELAKNLQPGEEIRLDFDGEWSTTLTDAQARRILNLVEPDEDED